MKRTGVRERGFSLMEMLVVVAIIGILMLVTIPNFMSMRKISVVKGGMRQFTNDLRAARQRAVTHSSTVRIAFESGNRKYCIFESTDEGTSWSPIGTQNPRYLPDNVYFENTTGATAFTDNIDDTVDSIDYGELQDIVFLRTGVARAPGGIGKVLVKPVWTDVNKQYTISIRTSGMVSTE